MQPAFPDHFSLFGLEPRFGLDPQALERAHRQLLSQVHPDRHAASDAASRRAALQWASRANEALEVLRRPSARAAYLCAQRGLEVDIEAARAMAPDLLTWLMQWREELDEARASGDGQGIERLADTARARRESVEAELASLLDGGAAPSALAADRVRELVFLEKLCAEAREALDGAAADR